MNSPRRRFRLDFRWLNVLTGCVFIAFAAILAKDPSVSRPGDANAGETPPKASDKSSKKNSGKVPAHRDAKTALAEFNSLIGQWRGVGMPRRNSQAGAWSETADWVWNFDKGTPTIHVHTKTGRLLDSAVLGWNDEKQTYLLHAHFNDKQERDYSGKLADDKLVLDSEPDKVGLVHRITITRLNPKRTIVLVENRKKDASFFNRVAEIGYTRQGTSLAVAGSNEPTCIVTGGKGTMTVSYKGQTYYVCCSGCKQAFEDDPEGIISEYKKRLAEKAAKEKSP